MEQRKAFRCQNMVFNFSHQHLFNIETHVANHKWGNIYQTKRNIRQETKEIQSARVAAYHQKKRASNWNSAWIFDMKGILVSLLIVTFMSNRPNIFVFSSSFINNEWMKQFCRNWLILYNCCECYASNEIFGDCQVMQVRQFDSQFNSDKNWFAKKFIETSSKNLSM